MNKYLLKNLIGIVILVIASNISEAQYLKNSSALSNIDLVLNPNPESSIAFKSYGSINEIPWVGQYGITETIADIMERERNNPRAFTDYRESKQEFRSPRRDLPPTPGLDVFQWPVTEYITPPPIVSQNPQTIGTSFLGTQISESGFIPPDCMGDVGPTQILVAANGRIKVFSKSGILGPLDADMDVFFNSVRNGSETSDPHIRYDRLSQRWFVVIINVASTNNRVLIAVSSGSTISGSSSFTFFQFQHNLVAPSGDNNRFADYPTLGVDANALYIGVNNFTSVGSFVSISAFVVRKSSISGGGPIVATVFRNLSVFTPQGVDNDDPNSTQGFFVGVNVSVFSQLDILRISDPGGTPSIDATFNLSVPTTTFPEDVRHQGQIGNRRLDALDDRLFAAHLRENKITGVQSLWTAHNIEVNSSGIGSTSGNRTACRWYEITNLSTTPTLNQSGTLFDPAVSDPQFFWIPSVAMSGQGHMSLSSSRAGVGEYAEIVIAGRLSSDPLGTTQSFTVSQTSTTSYNVQATNPQRWGDYSQTVIDPTDDMTMWTFQEYCNATNSWGVRVTELVAPPPVTPTTADPAAVAPNQSSVNVVITGTSVSGSGFFDPGNDVGGPGFTNRISASVTGSIVVNSVTFNSPAQVTLNISTVGVTDGFYDVTITNPDAQSATGFGILQIDSAVPVELSLFVAKLLLGGKIRLDWRTETEVNNYGFEIERALFDSQNLIWLKIGFIDGHGNSNSPKEYSFIDDKVTAGKYNYRLKQIDNDGTFEYSKLIEIDVDAPLEFELSQNYPNPFNPSTTITFSLPENGIVSLSVYNMLGEEIQILQNGLLEAGMYSYNFNAEGLPSGLYIYKLSSKNKTQTRKMLLLK